VTLFPLSVFVFRAQMGAVDPTDVFIPILLTTYIGTVSAFMLVAWIQKIRILDPVILLYLGGFSAAIIGMVLWFLHLPAEEMQQQSALFSHIAILTVVALIVGAGILKKIEIFSEFIEGAKEGFTTAVKIIPYLVAMLAAIALFRSSGLLELIMNGVRNVVLLTGFDARWIDGLPTGLMKTLSGSGARAMMIDAMQAHGADSFTGRLVSVIQGSTETTFYVLAVYFGSVGIKNMRYALACGLFADAIGFIAAVGVTYWFFG
jgi:spore maturation protein SpmB